MAGGGSFLSYNKVRAGAYINFAAVPKSSMTVGDRGIVALGLPLSWGANNALIEVLSSDLIDGESKKKVGFTVYDSDSKLLAGALNYAYKALVYRTTTNGAKATATIGKIKADAKYTGTFGNKINMAISEDTVTNIFTVTTYVDGEVKDEQKIAEASELESNDYVDFTVLDSGDIVETSGTPLSGGTDGVVDDATVYPAMFSKLRMSSWQTFACFSTDSGVKSSVSAFIHQMREDEGKYVQGVVNNYNADYEGIINSVSGAVINDVEYSPSEFVAIVAGITAGSNLNESNTSREIIGATSIIGEKTNSEIIDSLNNGEFLLSSGSDGTIRIEKDINSLHTFTISRPYAYSKNRVMRVLDEIATTIKLTWERTYMGKVSNTDIGRVLFKSDVSQYLTELQRLSAIQNFNGSSDIDVRKGSDVDVVICDLYIQPVDSMEKLYLTIAVNS